MPHKLGRGLDKTFFQIACVPILAFISSREIVFLMNHPGTTLEVKRRIRPLGGLVQTLRHHHIYEK